MKTTAKIICTIAALALVGTLPMSQAEAARKKPLLERVAAEPEIYRPGKKSSTKVSKKSSKASKKAKGGLAAASTGGRLSTDITFDGADVNGKYHSAGEAVAKVETDKKLNELIGMRRDFKDRMQAEKERLRRGETSEL